MATHGIPKVEERARRTRERMLDRAIDQFRQRLDELDSLTVKGKTPPPLDGFDSAAELLIATHFGESSDFLDAYEYARFGEAGGLVNVEDDAQEAGERDPARESLRQRRRVLESCIWELESRRAVRPERGRSLSAQMPKVSEYMTEEVRSVRLDATLKDAGKLFQKYKIGLLFVDDDRRYVGVITESGMSRNAVAKGLDPNATVVKVVMSRTIVSIEDNEPLVEAVKLMKAHAIRHLAVTKNDTVVGIISISDLLRYYSGVS